MSRTTPRSYYEQFVQPNFWEYMDDPADIRRAFNASVPAFQLADVMYTFYRDEDPSKIAQWPDLKDLYIYLEKFEPHAWITIHSVTTAYKHLRLAKSHYVIGSPGALWSLTLPSDTFDLETSWNDDPKGDVIVRYRDSNTEVSLMGALSAVVERIWPSVLPPET